MSQYNNERKVALAATVFIAIIFGLLIATFMNHHGKAAVKVVVLPPDSTLTIDGKTAKAGTIYFTKTKHTLKASRQYFGTVSQTVNFATYNTSQTLYIEPTPNSQQALDYLIHHPDIQRQREAVGGIAAGRAQEQLSKITLLSLLPYTGPSREYLVDYGTATIKTDGTQKVTIYIEANTDQAKQDALNWIKSQKTNPSSLAIVYEALPANTSGSSSIEGGSEYQ